MSYLLEHLEVFKSVALINQKKKYVFYTIYKNASTKIRRELESEDCIYFDRRIKHRNIEDKSKIESINNLVLKFLSEQKLTDYFKVSLVRNPYYRFISCFFYFKGSKRGKLMKIFPDTDINEFISRECNQTFIKRNEYKSNFHFNSQSFFLCFNNRLIPDKIVYMENFEEVISELSKHGIHLSPEIINSSNNDNYDILTEQSKQILQQVYYQDFVNFFPELLKSDT